MMAKQTGREFLTNLYDFLPARWCACIPNIIQGKDSLRVQHKSCPNPAK
jgi:hypothetical protein